MNKPRKPKSQSFSRTLAKPDVEQETRTGLLAPSPNPATNLLIVDVLVRAGARLARKQIEHRVVEATYKKDPVDEQKAKALIGGRGMLTSLGLYGVSKIATKGPLGLGAVTGGLILKTLYDRGYSRQQRRRRGLPSKK